MKIFIFVFLVKESFMNKLIFIKKNIYGGVFGVMLLINGDV